MKKAMLTDRVLLICFYAVLAVIGTIVLIPILYAVSVSLTPYSEVLKRGGVILWPTQPTIEYYAYILSAGSPVVRAFGVTLLVTSLGTALSLIVTAAAAYPLSKKYLPGRKIFMYLFVITMLFTGGIVPTFLLVRSLGLLDTLWALMLPSLLRVFNMIVMRTFFSAMPESLEEAARLDGCSDVGVFFRIVLPSAGAVLATIGMFYAVMKWNMFFDALIYISTPAKYTLQVVLRNILLLTELDELQETVVAANIPPTLSLQMTSAMIALLPMLFVYPFVQRFFVKGMMIGSVKG